METQNSGARDVFEPENKIQFVVVLRAVASLMVMFSHLMFFYDANKIHSFFFGFIRDHVIYPFAIIQNFGFFGVVLFFLVSGFIVSYVSRRDGGFAFLIKRVFRIYPPLILSVLLITLIYSLYTFISHETTDLMGISFVDIFTSSTLINYLIPNSVKINPVAWTLIIEMVFYFICFLTLPLLKNKPKIAILINLFFVFMVICFYKSFGDTFYLFAVTVCYLPFLFLGQLIYFLWDSRITFRVFLLSSIANYVLIVYGLLMKIYPTFYAPGNSYLITFVYAYFTFVLLLLLNKHIKRSSIINFFSKISYSLYLYNRLIALFLVILVPLVGFVFGSVLTLTLIVIISYLSWRFAEEFFRQFARKIITKLNL
ncbi:MAG: acyltransferase [Candidatus Gracilibacteria bacterium]|jgi:peptidoglycan/LPS O-acetylase OafA/YrhL